MGALCRYISRRVSQKRCVEATEPSEVALQSPYRDRSTQAPRLRMWFYAHFLLYLLASTVFFLVNLTDGSGESWFLWPVLGWGCGILIHGVTLYLYLRGHLDGPERI